jgi:gamma-glutamylputrescine oxidase
MLQEEQSHWIKPDSRTYAELTTDLEADCVVVGAGYAGLNAAIAMAEQGQRVLVLEQGYPGYGASGRNAGHLTPAIGKDVPSLLAFFGRKKARQLVLLADQAVQHVEQLIEHYGIDCDYNPSGNIMAGVHPCQERKLRKAAHTASSMGAKMHFMDSGQMREAGLPGSFLFGIKEEMGGTLHPGKFLDGLIEAALKKTVKIVGNARVGKIEETPSGIAVHAAGHVITCSKLISCINAYNTENSWYSSILKKRQVPVSVCLFETARLTEEDIRSIDWKGREGIYTAHEILESYRLTADNTIVGGSKQIYYRYGSQLQPDYNKDRYDYITAAFRERFPQLSHVGIQDTWSGFISFALDFLPIVGTNKKRTKAHAAAFAGHGVAMASYCGRLAALSLQGEQAEGHVLLQKKTIPLPPEPLRWMIVRFIRWLLTILDRRTDSRIRKLPKN